MKALNVAAVAAGLLTGMPMNAHAQTPAQPLSLARLVAECAPEIHPATLNAVVRTESSWNPYAIGVVGGRLARQPRDLSEAVATARELERQGFNFSLGLGQVNRYNLSKYGETYDTVFEPCRNLKAGGAILKDCFLRAKVTIGDEQQALRAAFSCYYSGNFTRGFRPDQAGQPSYVQKVVANATGAAQPIPVVPAVRPQSTEGAVPVRPAATATPPAALAQWVIFADAPPSGRQVAPAKTPAVKVQLVTPGRGAAAADAVARTEPVAVQRAAQATPVPHSPSNSAPQDAPFVQFVN